jgi:hypothetical protein
MPINVATLTLGSWPRQRFARVRAKRSVRECENEDSHSQVSSHFGNWSPGGLPNLQKAITKVKTPRIKDFFYIIEKLLKCRCLKWARMTHLDICNTSYGKKKGQESKLAIWFPTTKVENQPDFVRASGVWHAVGKISTRATTLLQTSSRSKVWARSYSPTKLREFQP